MQISNDDDDIISNFNENSIHLELLSQSDPQDKTKNNKKRLKLVLVANDLQVFLFLFDLLISREPPIDNHRHAKQTLQTKSLGKLVDDIC